MYAGDIDELIRKFESGKATPAEIDLLRYHAERILAFHEGHEEREAWMKREISKLKWLESQGKLSSEQKERLLELEQSIRAIKTIKRR